MANELSITIGGLLGVGVLGVAKSYLYVGAVPNFSSVVSTVDQTNITRFKATNRPPENI